MESVPFTMLDPTHPHKDELWNWFLHAVGIWFCSVSLIVRPTIGRPPLIRILKNTAKWHVINTAGHRTMGGKLLSKPRLRSGVSP